MLFKILIESTVKKVLHKKNKEKVCAKTTMANKEYLETIWDAQLKVW